MHGGDYQSDGGPRRNRREESRPRKPRDPERRPDEPEHAHDDGSDGSAPKPFTIRRSAHRTSDSSHQVRGRVSATSYSTTEAEIIAAPCSSLGPLPRNASTSSRDSQRSKIQIRPGSTTSADREIEAAWRTASLLDDADSTREVRVAFFRCDDEVSCDDDHVSLLLFSVCQTPAAKNRAPSECRGDAARTRPVSGEVVFIGLHVDGVALGRHRGFGHDLGERRMRVYGHRYLLRRPLDHLREHALRDEVGYLRTDGVHPEY